MKNKKLLFTLIFWGIALLAKGQNINWASFKAEQHHLAFVNTGFDYGFIADVGYGYKFNKKRPILTTIDYSFPFGNKPFDDFKTKVGAQSEVVKIRHFSAIAKVSGIFRRDQTSLTRLANVGGEALISVGYYKPKWFLAFDMGFDKAIATNIKHADLMKEMNPDIKNGWYLPTGGNFSYGIQSGYSFKTHEVTLKLGKTATQNISTTALFPIYLLLGYNFRL